MKTRILHTKIWHDNKFAEFSINGKLLFLFLISNEYVGLTGVYEISDRMISFYTGLTVDQITEAKKEFGDSFIFDDGWVVIKNHNKYNNYLSNSLQKKAYMKEYSRLPKLLQVYVDEVESEPYAEQYQKNNGVYKHRLIVEKILGRKLLDTEVVHHIDKNPKNNALDNLAVMSKEVHVLLHKGKIDLSDKRIILVKYKYDTSIILERNKKPEIRNKNKKDGGVGEERRDEKTSDGETLALTRNQKTAFQRTFRILTSKEIEDEYVKCKDYMAMSSEPYGNPGLFFKSWLEKVAKEKNIRMADEKREREWDEKYGGKFSDEKREKNLERLEEMKKKLLGKGIL